MNNTIVIADAILSNLMSKYKLVRKNPSREYFIADYNIDIIRRQIDSIFTRKGSGVIYGVVQDKHGVILLDEELDNIIYDIIFIMLIHTENKKDLIFGFFRISLYLLIRQLNIASAIAIVLFITIHQIAFLLLLLSLL
jgi:hypothetical protein